MDASINICRNIIKSCVSFRGRINRSQYWLFVLTALIVIAIAARFTVHIPELNLWQIFVVLLLLPYISATVKRLHDIGKSGYWFLSVLVPIFGWIYLFVLCVENGKEGKNRYGEEEDWSII